LRVRSYEFRRRAEHSAQSENFRVGSLDGYYDFPGRPHILRPRCRGQTIRESDAVSLGNIADCYINTIMDSIISCFCHQNPLRYVWNCVKDAVLQTAFPLNVEEDWTSIC
jgi:hypothetical protein